MLTTIRDRVAALIASGATLDQVIAAQAHVGMDEKRVTPPTS